MWWEGDPEVSARCAFRSSRLKKYRGWESTDGEKPLWTKKPRTSHEEVSKCILFCENMAVPVPLYANYSTSNKAFLKVNNSILVILMENAFTDR